MNDESVAHDYQITENGIDAHIHLEQVAGQWWANVNLLWTKGPAELMKKLGPFPSYEEAKEAAEQFARTEIANYTAQPRD